MAEAYSLYVNMILKNGLTHFCYPRSIAPRRSIVEEQMMTARQVAAMLGVHENWVYDQAATGVLPSYKIGGTRRFLADELRGWIAEHRQPSPERVDRKRTRRKPAPPSNARRSEPQPKLFE
jgi:excisionase family DNA binding protein